MADHVPNDDRPFSQIVEDIGARPDANLYLGELVNAFGERGFGALMLFLGLISAVVGIIPGSTTVIGTPILILAFQLIIRRDQVWLPKWVLNRHIDRADYRSSMTKVLGPLRKVERLSRRRLKILSSDVGEMFIGLACFLLAFILILPLWGGNLVPSLIIATFGFGLMQRDGYVILAGWLGVTGVGLFIWLAWELVSRLIASSWDWVTGLV